MSDVDVLVAEFTRRRTQPVSGADLARVLQLVAQMVSSVQDNRQFINALEKRLLIVDDLPLEAPLGALLRRRNGTLGERATLYMGNGPGQPITKLPTPAAV